MTNHYFFLDLLEYSMLFENLLLNLVRLYNFGRYFLLLIHSVAQDLPNYNLPS